MLLPLKLLRYLKLFVMFQHSFPIKYLGCNLFVWGGGGILQKVQLILANFFWGTNEFGLNIIKSNGQIVAFFMNKGGLGMRRLEDFCTTFAMKC